MLMDRVLYFFIFLFSLCFNAQAKTLIFSAPQGGDFKIKTGSKDFLDTKTLRGNNILLFFGYTKCKSICPFTFKNLQQALTELSLDDRQNTKIVFVSVDTDRDRPTEIASYAKSFGPEFNGGTNTDKALKEILKMYGARYYKFKTSSGAVLIDHTSDLFIINKKGLWTDSLKFDASSKEIISALKKANTLDKKEQIFPESRIVKIIKNSPCTLNTSECLFTINTAKYSLSVSDKNIRPNTDYKLILTALSKDENQTTTPVEVDIQGVELSMGYNRPGFKQDLTNKNIYTALFSLPQCEIKKMNWTLTLIFKL